MAQISKFLRSIEGGRLQYWCQGCERSHVISVEGEHAWGYNGNPDCPTFSPSVLTQYDFWEPPVGPHNIEEYRKNPWEQTKVRHVCHTFIRDGMVQFLGDCTHKFAGQTVPLPELPEYLRDPE